MMPTHAAVSESSEPKAAAPAPSAADDSPGDAIVLDTRFGRMAFDPGHTIAMPRGMMGFTEHKDYGLAQLPQAGVPNLFLLQSLTDAALSFLLVPLDSGAGLIEAADIEAVREELSIAGTNCAVLVVVSVREFGGTAQVSVNLRAPVFIDTERRMAWQYVLPNGRYPIRHVIATSKMETPRGAGAAE